MRGILSWGAYLPYRRLDRTQIAPLIDQGGGRGTRTVAGFDEDPTTMAVAAARLALRPVAASPDIVLFASVTPAYADKTNATAVHAALGMPDSAAAFDIGASTRSAAGGLLLAARYPASVLVATADIRVGLAGSAEEADGGDAAAAVLFGDDAAAAPVLAEVVASASVSREFVDRWRAPGERRSKVWDEKFSEVTYQALAQRVWDDALEAAALAPGDVAAVAVAAPTARIAATIASRLGAAAVVDDMAATVGQAGAAQPGLLLAALLESASPGDVLVLLSAADGADALVLRATAALAEHRTVRPLADQTGAGAPLPYGRFLSWRGNLAVEPPRRPEPQRVSATAAARGDQWKFGLVASRDRVTGAVHAPPVRVSADGTRTDEMDALSIADAVGTIATFTIDRLAFSPSPPIVFAVIDFDGGGRLPVELTDCDADEIAIGMRVEMTFRRLFTADGMPDYFWKARPVRG